MHLFLRVPLHCPDVFFWLSTPAFGFGVYFVDTLLYGLIYLTTADFAAVVYVLFLFYISMVRNQISKTIGGLAEWAGLSPLA